MSTGCHEEEQQLSLYLDERLDEPEAAAFAVHLVDCEACRKAVDATRSMRESTALREAPAAPAFLMDNVMARIAALPEAETAPESTEGGLFGWLQNLLPTLRIAAPLTSGVAACLLIWSLASPPAPHTTSAAATAASTTSTSEQMLFGGEDTTSTKQLVQGLWDTDDEPKAKGD